MKRFVDIVFWLLVLWPAVFVACNLVNCTGAQTHRSLVIAEATCAELARAYERPDLEAVCRAGGDIAAILESVLKENRVLRASQARDGGVDAQR